MSPTNTLFLRNAQARPSVAATPRPPALVQRIAPRPTDVQRLLARALDSLNHRSRTTFVALHNHAAAEMLQALDFLRQHPVRNAAWENAPFGLAPRQIDGGAATLIGSGLAGLGALERHDEMTLQRLAADAWRTLTSRTPNAQALPVHLTPLARVYGALAAGTHELAPGASRAAMRYLNAALVHGRLAGLQAAAEAMTAKFELKLELHALAERAVGGQATAAAPAQAQATRAVDTRALAGNFYFGNGTYGARNASASQSSASTAARPPLVAPLAAPPTHRAAAPSVPEASPPTVATLAPVQVKRRISSPIEEKPTLAARATALSEPTASDSTPAAPAGNKRRAEAPSEGEAKRPRKTTTVQTPSRSPTPPAATQNPPSPVSMSASTSLGGTPPAPLAEIQQMLGRAANVTAARPAAVVAIPPAPVVAATTTARVGIDGMGTLEVPTPWIGAMLRLQPPGTGANANANDWRTVGFAGLKLQMTLAGLHTLVHDGGNAAVTTVRGYAGDVSLPVGALRQLIAVRPPAELGDEPVRVEVDGLGATLPLAYLSALLGTNNDVAA